MVFRLLLSTGTLAEITISTNARFKPASKNQFDFPNFKVKTVIFEKPLSMFLIGDLSRLFKTQYRKQ